MNRNPAHPPVRRLREPIPWGTVLPVVFVVLGCLAIGSLLFVNTINDEQRQLHAASDDLLGVQREVAMFHAQLDERLGGDDLEQMGELWSSLRTADGQLGRMLNGGLSPQGFPMNGLDRDELRRYTENLRFLLSVLESSAKQLLERRDAGEFVRLTDERFHDAYGDFMTTIGVAEGRFHGIMKELYAKSRIAFAGMLGSWGLIVFAVAWGARRFGAIQKTAEEQLAVLASFPERNPNPVLEADADGRVHYMNRVAEDLPALRELGPAHPFLSDMAAIAGELRTGKKVYVMREVEADGTWYSETLHHVPETGRIRIYALDISTRKRVDEALRQSEKRYRELFDVAQEGIWVIDRDANTTLVNKSMAHMLGYEVEDMIGRSLYSFMDEAGVEISRRNIERRKQGIREQHDFELLRSDGRRIYTTMETAPILDADGNYAGAIAGVMDISERRRVEEDLRASQAALEQRVEERTARLREINEDLEQEIIERRETEALLTESKDQYKRLFREFNTLLDAIQDPLLLLSPELIVLWGNEAASSGLVPDRAHLSEFRCHDLIHRRDDPCNDCPVLKSFATRRAETARINTAEGRILELRSYPVLGEKGEAFNVILTVNDTTETTELQAEALRTAHLASLGEMAAGVAHEINNPINGIINYSQILANLSPEGSEERELAGRIIKEGDRIAVIVRSLLSFARNRTEGKARVHIGDIIGDALALVNAQMRKDGIALQVDVPRDIPPLWAHPHQIQQVILNILNNGRFALNKKYPGADENKRMQIVARPHLVDGVKYVRTVFLDYGTGIPEGILKSVVNPFFSTKPRGEGTGLGLSISHGIITDHKGKLNIESAEGKHTRIVVDLPVSEPEGPAET